MRPMDEVKEFEKELFKLRSEKKISKTFQKSKCCSYYKSMQSKELFGRRDSFITGLVTKNKKHIFKLYYLTSLIKKRQKSAFFYLNTF